MNTSIVFTSLGANLDNVIRDLADQAEQADVCALADSNVAAIAWPSSYTVEERQAELALWDAHLAADLRDMCDVSRFARMLAAESAL